MDDREVSSAAHALLAKIGSTGFAHYWEDYVLEQDARRDEITLNRRRCLLAVGVALATSGVPTTEDVVESARAFGMNPDVAQREIDEFVSREFLLRDGSGIRPRVNLFARWIADVGQTEIVLTSTELESARKAIDERERWRVARSEAEELVSRWDAFGAQSISADELMEYLRQFGSAYNQRLIFKTLTLVQFFGRATEERLLKDAYEIVQTSMHDRLGSWKSDQIRITHTGTVGKGSSGLGRAFATTNGLLRGQHVISPGDAVAAVGSGVSDLVVVDDFVGTGQTLSTDLEDLLAAVQSGLHLHVFALAGLDVGVDRVAARASELFGPENVTFRCLEEISSNPGPFSVESGGFESDREARDARALVEDYGARILKSAPMGFGGTPALVVFSRAIPNNAPPILWKKSSGEYKFRPLFPRN